MYWQMRTGDGSSTCSATVNVLSANWWTCCPSASRRLSKHLRVLRDAGFVASRVDAQRRVYRVRTEPLREIDDWLAPYRVLWTASLDALERRLDGMDD